MNEALLPVVNGLEFLSPPLPQEKQETLVRRVLEQGAVENLPGAQKASTAVPAIVPDAAAPPEKRRGGFRGRGRLWAVWRLRWPCAPVQPSSVRYSILLP